MTRFSFGSDEMNLSQAEFIELVDGFNSEEPTAIEYFTQRFHQEQSNALGLLFQFTANSQPEFLLGYIQWALQERVQGLSLGKEHSKSLTIGFSDELAWLKKLCHLLANSLAELQPGIEWQLRLVQILVRRCMVLYRSNPTASIRSIQLILGWTKVTLSMLDLAAQTGERNIIMPMFATWANRIQTRHQQPLPLCPEVKKLKLSFMPHIAPQDWLLVSERLHIGPSNELLLAAAAAHNVPLVELLLNNGYPRDLKNGQQLQVYYRQLLLTRLPDQSFLELHHQYQDFNKPGFCKLLIDCDRLELLEKLGHEWSHVDYRFLEDCILEEAAHYAGGGWLDRAERAGMLSWMMHEASPFFQREITRLTRSNRRLTKFF